MNTPLNTPNGTTFNCIIFFVLTNRYGHPHKETVERLESVQSKIYNTALNGAVTIWTDGKIYGIRQFIAE